MVAKTWGDGVSRTCGVIQAHIWVPHPGESNMKSAFFLCNNCRAEGWQLHPSLSVSKMSVLDLMTDLDRISLKWGIEQLPLKAFTTSHYNTQYHLLKKGWLVIGTKSLNTKKLELNRSPKFVTSSFCCIITFKPIY